MEVFKCVENHSPITFSPNLSQSGIHANIENPSFYQLAAGDNQYGKFQQDNATALNADKLMGNVL